MGGPATGPPDLGFPPDVLQSAETALGWQSNCAGHSDGSTALPKRRSPLGARATPPLQRATNVSWKRRKGYLAALGQLEDPCCLVAQLCPTLCDPLDFGLPGSPVHGIFQARILERVAIFLL